MKELSRLEWAIVKRTALNVKNLQNKRDKLLAKIKSSQEELKTILESIESFEAPIKTMSGGFTSEELLNGGDKLAVAPESDGIWSSSGAEEVSSEHMNEEEAIQGMDMRDLADSLK